MVVVVDAVVDVTNFNVVEVVDEVVVVVLLLCHTILLGSSLQQAPIKQLSGQS